MGSASLSSYLTSGRLADVMTLIQVLAFDPSARRSGDGLEKQLSRRPLSATAWAEVARLHPEFFRLLVGHEGQRESISLVARFVIPAVPPSGGGDPKTPPLSAELANTLMNLAIQLHDREIQRRDRWKSVVMPMIVAVVAATASIIAAVISTSRDSETPTVQTAPSSITGQPTPANRP